MDNQPNKPGLVTETVNHMTEHMSVGLGSLALVDATLVAYGASGNTIPELGQDILYMSPPVVIGCTLASLAIAAKNRYFKKPDSDE